MTAKWMDGHGFKTRHDSEIQQVQSEVDAVETSLASLTSSQLTKLGIVAPKINDIAISTTEDFNLKAVEILKFAVGAENQVNTVATFANGESSDFVSDDQLVFDGVMKLKTAYSDAMTSDGALGSGYKFSSVLPKSTFKKIESLAIAGASEVATALGVSMTSNSAPSPYVTSASSTFSASYPAWASFSPSNANHWIASAAGTQWLKIDLGAGYKIIEYDLATKGVSDASFVSAWTLRGSDTGSFSGEETVVDTRTGRSSSTTQVRYVCASPAIFRYYQWRFTAGHSYYGCGEIALHYAVLSSKHLFEDGSSIKTLVAGTLSTVGSTPVTEAMFTGSGIPDITLIGNTQIQALSSGTPKFLVYDTSSSAKTLDSTRVPLSKLILPNGDINITSVEGIDSVSLTANTSGSGVVRSIVSIDEGVTWRRWNGSSWVTITPDASTVLANGMTPATMNALVRANWNALTGTGDTMTNTIRFGYLLDMTNSTDVANVDNISATFDMRGSWKKAIHGTDYTYEYPRNNVLRVELLTNGDYKINY